MTILNLFEGVWSQGGNWQSGEITLSKDHINIVTLLATLLHHWQHFYTIGNIVTLLTTLLHHWQHFYIVGNIVTLLETLLHYWQHC